jgi:hypothetical protein
MGNSANFALTTLFASLGVSDRAGFRAKIFQLAVGRQTGSQVGLEAGVGKGLLDGTRLVSWPLLEGVKCSASL